MVSCWWVATGSVPEICRFYGIVVRMFYDDHGPPHFHAEYGGDKASFGFDGSVREGHLPRRAANMVLEWAVLHRSELDEAWRRVERDQPPGRIAPLR